MSQPPLSLKTHVERWPIAGAFTISRGAKTEAVVVVAEIADGRCRGRGECVPYARYGETVERRGRGDRGMSAAIARRPRPATACRARCRPARRATRSTARCGTSRRQASGRPVWELAGLAAPHAGDHRLHDLARHARGDGGGRRQGGRPPLLKIKLGGDGDAARIAAVRGAAPEAD